MGMVPHPDFHRIRPVGGLQHTGFEVLCCQLAEHDEDVPDGSRFRRIGGSGGDAGVECFHVLADDSVWAWQAKYFTLPLRGSQWHQIDRSVRRAIDSYPRLARYVVCVPRDLNQSELARWDEYCEQWESAAKAKGLSVRFVLWGKHQIVDRLRRPALSGAARWWFGTEELSDEWFGARFEEVKKDVGTRYTPEIHVDLPISQAFEGLTRSRRFFRELREKQAALRRAWQRLEAACAALQQDGSDAYCPTPPRASAVDLLAELETAASSDPELGGRPFAVLGIPELAKLSNELQEASRKCWDSLARVRREEDTSQSTSREHESAQHAAWDMLSTASAMGSFLNGDSATAADNPVLIVLGKAGVGKTHLLCDVAQRRLGEGLPTILLRGVRFAAGRDPWYQLFEQLHLDYQRPEDFLGAMQACADACNCRAIIMIDALNEGDGSRVWPEHLAGMASTLRRYPGLALACTCRTSYERLILPDSVEAVRTEHEGFAEHEVEAAHRFFRYYGIELPSAPLMLPEYGNPLMLKLLCEGLAKKGMNTVPDGLYGIPTVFEFLLDATNENVTKDFTGFAPQDRIVQRAVDALAGRMADRNDEWLDLEVAHDAVRESLATIGFTQPLLRRLVQENLLTQDMVIRYDVSSNRAEFEGISFTYQRFAHHAIAHRMVSRDVDPRDPAAAFREGGALQFLLRDETAAWRHSGVIEALAVCLPERCGFELAEAVPESWRWYPVRKGFCESLIWRRSDSVTDKTIECLNDVLTDSQFSYETLDQLVALTTRPDHPLNAEALDRCLRGMSMPERDAWWSYYLHRRWGTGAAPERLLWWAESDAADVWSDESARLCAIALSWFLTTSHRSVRDRATKAIVALLRNRLGVLRQMLDLFRDVDDPYISERLFCSGYGCAMLNQGGTALTELAKHVYDTEFRDGRPAAHILQRDYARGVIETAVARGCLLTGVDVSKIRPPYQSDWPLQVPAEADIEPFDTDDYRSIWFSVLSWGDFARYTMGSDIAAPFIRGFEFDIGQAQRWVFQRVLDLGWTPHRFGSIDKMIESSVYRFRSEDKPERFGKKYQWIAWHQLLAHVADNCSFQESYSDDDAKEYRGPWQFFLRDTDPSLLAGHGGHNDGHRNDGEWWAPKWDGFEQGRQQPDDQWVRAKDDLPDPRGFVHVLEPESGTVWLSLQSHSYQWREERPPEADQAHFPERQIWYHLHSWVVRREHCGSVLRWMRSRCLWNSGGLRLPLPRDCYRVFIGEYPWASSYAHLKREWTDHLGWDDVLPHPIAVTAEDYHWERGYDCSIEGTVNGWILSPLMLRTFGLKWTGHAFDFEDEQGRVVAKQPGGHYPRCRVLLFRKDALQEYLDRNSLDMFWVVIGEKNVLEFRPDLWPGRLKFEGLYRLRDGAIQVVWARPEFVSPDTYRG